MNSIKNIIGIKESILSSTGTGLKTKVEQWIKDNYFDNTWSDNKCSLNDDITISFKNGLKKNGLSQIPCAIKNSKYVVLDDYRGESIFVPEQCEMVDIENSNSLKLIKAKPGSSCKKFEVYNCKNVIIEDSLKDCVFDNVYIHGSQVLEDVNFFKNVNNTIQFVSCSKINEIALDIPNIKLLIENCGVTNIDETNCKSIKIEDCSKLKSIHIKEQIDELIISNCSKIKEIILDKPIHTLVIKDCGKLETININVVDEDLALTKLPSLTSVDVADAKKAVVSFAKIPIEPKFAAKKIAIR